MLEATENENEKNGSLVSRFTKGKQQRVETKPNFALNHSCSYHKYCSLLQQYLPLNQLLLFQTISAALLLLKLLAFYFSSRNPGSFPEKSNYKYDVSTFFFLGFFKDLSNGEKRGLVKNVFVPISNCVFPITKENFCYNWFGL